MEPLGSDFVFVLRLLRSQRRGVFNFFVYHYAVQLPQSGYLMMVDQAEAAEFGSINLLAGAFSCLST